MLTAVWVAVVAFVIGVGVAVYVMLKAARLLTERSAAIASLREREDLLIDRASAVIDRAGEQIARTETVTASMDGVTASMADVTASMAELRGRITALTPQAQPGPDSGGALTWTAALAYGLARALGLRWAALPWPRAQEAAARPARRTLASGSGPAPMTRSGPVTGSKPAPVSGQPRAALTGRRAAAAGRRGSGGGAS
jgi:hypothetical protein